MTKFPVDAPKARVLRALGLLGFQLVREREHIAMVRDNGDGTRTINTTEPRTVEEFHVTNDLRPSWY